MMPYVIIGTFISNIVTVESSAPVTSIVIFTIICVHITALPSMLLYNFLSWIFSSNRQSLLDPLNEINSKSIAKYVNVFTLPFTVLYFAIKYTPATIRFIIKFTKNVFVMIHSDIRLLCAVSVAMGTGAGFFAGSALIGGIVGALLGVASYEIVSKRILKLAPSNIKR